MKLPEEVTSKVIKVDKNQQSVRTPIPSYVRKNLGLQSGDTLIWETFIENEDIYVKIRKKED